MTDFAQFGMEMTREQEMISTKKRLETFQFCRTTNGPLQTAPLEPTASSARPHSRNGSVSLSVSNSTNSVLSTSSEFSTSSSGSRPSSLASGRSRPASHHRRRSSVSTRVESAEMMGVALPDLPPSSSDDNINFGDRDSIRRRALLALEGKNDFGPSNSTVEIPELCSQGIPQKPVELKLATVLPPFGLSPSLSAKRDSFGKFLSSASSLKDQLHTLMEEEEEEEEVQNSLGHKFKATTVPVCKPDETGCSSRDHHALTPNSHVGVFGNPDASELSAKAPSPALVCRRPASLTLRPLSLTYNSCSPSLSTPSLNPNSRPGLRALSLAPLSETSSVAPLNSADDWINQLREQNNHADSGAPASLSSGSLRRQSSLSGESSSPSPKRHSTISYIRSVSIAPLSTTSTAAGLPTPGATPTSERRPSTSSISSFGSFGSRDRRNMSEDMFLHQSHVSLLARIAELERALASRPRSRPVSFQSDFSVESSQLPDEMLQLVADLKTERDELNVDIKGWRQRVKELENAKILLERQLDAERREGWLKGENLDLLEVEKCTLARQVRMNEDELSSISRKLETTQVQLRQALQECDALKEDAETAKRQLAEVQSLLNARKGVEIELCKVREALAGERAYRDQLVRQLDAAGILQTPRVAGKSSGHMVFNIQARNNGLGFRSIDSACTTVDTEESHEALKAPFTLKAVEEESEMCDEVSEDDELARFEDEDESDLSFKSPMSSSSFDDDFPHSLTRLRLTASNTPVPFGSDVPLSSLSPSPSPFSSPCPTPIPPLSPVIQSVQHASHTSLSKTWTFPRGEQPPSRRSQEEVDRFFGCLEDVDDSSPVESCPTMDNKSLFSQRLQFADTSGEEELPPFILPAQNSVTQHSMLDTVIEVDEDEFRGNVGHNREKFTFPVSVSEDSLSWIPPQFEESVHEGSVSFVFPQMQTQQSNAEAAESSPFRSNNSVVLSKPITTASPSALVTPVRPTFPSPADRASPIMTPTSKVSAGIRALPPSRILPPFPPLFVQTKTANAHTTWNAPKRKAVPSVKSTNVAPATATPVKPVRAPVESSRKLYKPTPHSSYGSTFIPQLTASKAMNCSSFLSRSDTEAPTIETWTHPEHFVKSPSQPMFQTFTNLFPLTWATSRRKAERRNLAFVSKERQLARLRDSMTASSAVGMDGCERCRGSLISL